MADQALRIAVLGSGRMGQQLVQVIDDTSDCEVAGVWSRTTDSSLAELLAVADVAIDFTLAEATHNILSAAVEQPMSTEDLAASYEILADLHQRLGNSALAREFRQKARNLRSP